MFASQGVILGNNSTDEDRGKMSGIFISIYMFGSVVAIPLADASRPSATSLPASWSSCWV